MKRAILLVAFGASSAQGQSALKNFDARVRARFPGLPVRWAYTSLLPVSYTHLTLPTT